VTGLVSAPPLESGAPVVVHGQPAALLRCSKQTVQNTQRPSQLCKLSFMSNHAGFIDFRNVCLPSHRGLFQAVNGIYHITIFDCPSFINLLFFCLTYRVFTQIACWRATPISSETRVWPPQLIPYLHTLALKFCRRYRLSFCPKRATRMF